MEIERKFLVEEFPNLPVFGGDHLIEQGYLSVDPEVRIRSMIPYYPASNSYKLCIKGEGTIAREEIDIEISGAQFVQLKEMVSGTMIRKMYRKYIMPDGTKIEFSYVDEGTPHAFMYVEVEFGEAEDPYAFIPLPGWKEVTDDPEYKMKHYWRRWHSKCASTNQEK